MFRITLIILSILAAFLLSACSLLQTPAVPTAPVPAVVVNIPPAASPTTAPATAPTTAPSASVPSSVGMPNPASVNCEKQGGKLDIRKDPKGGEVGYCVFPDKSECEEWALMRGECKPGGAKPATTSLTDPFAYCSAVGAIDAPDARYTGPKTPDTVVHGLIKAMKLPANTSVNELARLTTWRCMNSKVYACNIGANIPCSEKADVNKTPTAAMNDYCKANSTSDFIPAVVTGRATVYEWKCASGKPQIIKQMTQADARGFLAEFWYEIPK